MSEEQNIKQQTVTEFANAVEKYTYVVGEAPHIYRLCHTHRAACLEHTDKVQHWNVVTVDRPICMMCN